MFVRQPEVAAQARNFGVGVNKMRIIRWLSLRAVLPLSAVVLCAQIPARYQLTQDWKAYLGPRDAAVDHTFRAAVCKDGSVYVSDGLGRLIRVDPTGRKVNDQAGISQIAHTLGLGCDGVGRAIAGTTAPGSLVVLEPLASGAEFSIVSQVRTKGVTPFEVLSLPAEQGYLVLGLGPGQKQPMHVISSDGQYRLGIGSFPQQASGSLSVRAGVNGTILWDSSRQHILYLPENPYKLSEFTSGGQVVAEHLGADPVFHPIAANETSGLLLPNDRVVGAALLAGGDLLVEVVKHAPIDPTTVSSSAYLQVVDANLNPRGLQTPTDDFGHLYGSDQNGNVYFTIISPTDGMNVVKAHAVRTP